MFKRVNWKKVVLFGIMMGIVTILNGNCAYADILSGTGMDYLIKHNISARLYDTNAYSGGGEGIALSNSGATVEGWDYKKSKYLQIDILVDASPDEVHVVELKLAPIFYIASDIDEIPAGYSKVEKIPYDKVACNNDQYKYTLQKGNGTFKYYLKPNMTRASIQVALRYDPILWDKLGGTSLTKEDVSPIEVSMYHVDSVIDNTLEVNASKIRVSKATSLKGIIEGGSITYRRIWDNARWNPTSNFYQYKEKIARFLLITTAPGREYINKYYEKMTIEIDVPYYEEDGKKVYVGYKTDTLRFDGVIGSNATKVNIEEATESKLIFSMYGYYAADDQFNMIDFVWPEGYEVDESIKSVKFSKGNAKLTINTNGGKVKTLIDTEMGYIEFTTTKKEDVSLGERQYTNALRSKYPDNADTKLGCVWIANYGTEDSTSKNIKFDFDERHLVTAVMLPSDVEMKTYTVKYTLKDENGQRVYLNSKGNRVDGDAKDKHGAWTITINNGNYGSNEFDNLRTNFYRTHLDKKHRSYYFDTIEYTIATVRTRTFLYDSGDTNYSASGAGTFYGKLASSAESGDVIKNQVTITSPEDSGIGVLKKTITSKVVDTETACYGINNTKLSVESTKAGQSVTISGRAFVYYTYYSADSTWLHNIRLAVVLPQGVSVDEDNIKLTTSKSKESVSIDKIQKKEAGDNNIWLIDVDKDQYIGYYGQNLGELTQGAALDFSIKINTDIYMDTQTLYTDRILYVVGMEQENVIDICAKGYKTKDIYDINEDGDTSDYIGCVRGNETKSCIINGEPPKLFIEDDVKVLDKAGQVREKDEIAFPTDIVQYDLSIKSLNDGTASSFDYYIPIPRKRIIEDDYLYSGEEEEAFDLRLLEKVILSGDNIYEIEYTTLSDLTYKNAREKSNIWYTADELEESGKTLSEVTMVKLKVKSGNIEKGMDTTITLKLGYAGVDIEEDKDKFIKWNSCGYYDFDDGVKFVSGHFPTNGVRLEVEPDESLLTKIVFVEDRNSIYYVYDVMNYDDVTMSEPIEFYVERPEGSSDVKFTISESDEYGSVSEYLSGQKVRLTDEAGNQVPAVNNQYIIKPNKKYTLRISSLSFGTSAKKRMDVYLYAGVVGVIKREHIQLIRVTAFEQH
ncbi:MAG: hypothetical protein E7262_02055 [Lachnospiraceae bacterium]|nr:hypothetical protein [Lachnospiraceae bacterium]